LSPLISNYFQHSVVYWEIGSFTKLGLWVGSCGFANVPMCGGKIFKTFGLDCVSPKSVRIFLSRCHSSIFWCLL